MKFNLYSRHRVKLNYDDDLAIVSIQLLSKSCCALLRNFYFSSFEIFNKV